MDWKAFAINSLLAMSLVGCAETSPDANAPGGSSARTVITVQEDQPGARINPAMWGAFFEDINFGADGGLYAEMVKNRSFEFPDAMMGWIKVSPSLAKGDVSIRTESPFRETNPHYVRIVSEAPAPIGISNEGFRGMGVKAGEAYDFSAQIRNVEGSSIVTVQLVGADGTTLDSVNLGGLSGEWSKITTVLHPNATDAHARLVVFLNGPGTVDFDFISLFPEKTWKNRPGGLRADMVQKLADLHPGFLRFPGGCIVEGSVLARRYQWKNTIGPIEDRKLLINRWNYEFSWRPTPDYYQSFGLGFFEFFQLCDDIGAEPLPIINCGMACQFNSGELCPADELGPYIQDALDLIEFANGPVTSTWGAKRAAMGHPEPFNMKMMGVGNEQWGAQYLERLALFTKAIKEKHPEIALVSDAGPSPEDDRFQYLWPRLQAFNAGGHTVDIVDQHCYANPLWFLSNSDRYDSYDRSGPKVFFGEYGAQSVAICSTKNRNNLECALSEAAFMTGLERNAAVVRMASYAPLFANVDAWQWTPDLIWTNSLESVATANYYVQQLYACNCGDEVLPTSNTAPVRDMLPAGRIGVGTSKASAEFKDVRVTASDGTETWKRADSVYQQSDPLASVSSYAGDTSWKDYTLTLKARKLAGEEGIVITVCDDGAGAFAQWILGGWGNTQHGIRTHYAEQDQLLQCVPGTLEANRWYDIKVTVKGSRMECYLDGKLVETAEILHHRVPSLFTSATRDNSTGETILKVVNPGDRPARTTIQLRGVQRVQAVAKTIVITGNPTDENSFDKPDTVVPMMASAKIGTKPEFDYTFKPHSVTVLRVGIAKEGD